MPLKRNLTEKSNCMRILCVGKVSSGKSTFINTVMSILEEKHVTMATGGILAPSKEGNNPNTLKVVKYPLETDEKTKTFIVDMPGFSENGVIDFDKIKLIIQGHIRNNFKFTEETIRKNTDSCVKNLELKDQIHVVCLFLDNESVSDEVPEWEVAMIKTLSKWMSREGIPFVVILTKMDKFKSELHEVYASVEKKFRFVESIVFPVQNLVNEDELVPDIKHPVLHALHAILDKGQKYIEQYDEE